MNSWKKAVLSLGAFAVSSWLSAAVIRAAEAEADMPQAVVAQVEAKPTPITPKGWSRFTSQKRKFVVVVPTATKKSQVQSGDLVDVAIFQGSTSAYIVSYAHLSAYGVSEKSLAREGGEHILESSIQGLIKGFSKGSPAKLKSTKKITLQGQLGRESVVVNPEAGIQAKVRSFYVDKQIYHIFVSGKEKTFPEKNADVFLNSFTLLK